MDLQKTGSTWVVSVLSGMLDEPYVHKSTHGPLREGSDRDKRYFVSVREPLSLYLSLFTFGCQKRGTAYRRLTNKGKGDLYDPTPTGFERWLEFILDPENASYINGVYNKHAPKELIGIGTFRLMLLGIPRDVLVNAGPMATRQEVEDFVRREVFFSAYVRTEKLADDVFGVLKAWEGHLDLKHPVTTVDDLKARFSKRNVSKKIAGLTVGTVNPELKQRVAERDWLFAKLFGYDQDPKGKPSALIAG
ncbi:MAG: hypothetical protein ACXW3D_06230 [Caulobacteraceae bacterium]